MSSIQEEIQLYVDAAVKVAIDDEIRSLTTQLADQRGLYVALSTRFGEMMARENALADRMTALEESIEQAIAECKAEGSTPSPTPVPVPVPVPAPVDPPGSFRWRGKLVTLSPTGQILFDGVLTPENAKTRNVQEAVQGPDGLLWQRNAAGEWYRWTGAASGDYERMPTGPHPVTASITASGSIVGP
jgi:hypothetical protein